MSELWERGTNLFGTGCFASIGRIGFYLWRAVLLKQFDAFSVEGMVPNMYGYGLHDCVRLSYGDGHCGSNSISMMEILLTV